MINSTWTIEQTVSLFSRCEKARRKGESLSRAFKTTAEETGRSVNSVRNYYYGQAKTFELVPDIAKRLGINSANVKRNAFVPFTEKEVDDLIKRVITQKAEGRSVRAVINELADGDAKKALRLQNKYRSVLRSHRDRVEGIMKDLSIRGVAYVDPYAREKTPDNFAKLTEYIASLDENKVGSFLSLIEKLT